MEILRSQPVLSAERKQELLSATALGRAVTGGQPTAPVQRTKQQIANQQLANVVLIGVITGNGN